MTKYLPLIGKRIILRPLQRSDAKALMKYANNKEVTKYTLVPHPYSEKDAFKFITRSQNMLKVGTMYALGIELKENKEIIGMMSFREVDPENRNAALSYWLGKPFWGKGITSEAIQLLVRFGFKRLHLQRIYARVMHPNLRSVRLLKKHGFLFEGRLQKNRYKNKRWYDHLIFGLLREDYLRTKRLRK